MVYYIHVVRVNGVPLIGAPPHVNGIPPRGTCKWLKQCPSNFTGTKEFLDGLREASA